MPWSLLNNSALPAVQPCADFGGGDGPSPGKGVTPPAILSPPNLSFSPNYGQNRKSPTAIFSSGEPFSPPPRVSSLWMWYGCRLSVSGGAPQMKVHNAAVSKQFQTNPP